MTEEILIAIKQSVKEGINGQLVAVHQQIASNEEKRIADHLEVKREIKELGEKIAPFDKTRTWFTQLVNGLKYIGVPTAALYGLAKLFNIIK